MCLLKSAIAVVSSASTQAEASILFDEGSQRSFLSQSLATSLHVQPHKRENIHLSSFGSQSPLTKQLDVAQIHLHSSTGEAIPLSVLIVPTISTPLRNTTLTQITQLPYLKGISLAHPVTEAAQFEISLLIGADHYWDIVEDHINRGSGPTAMKSKIGYLLSGPLSHSENLITNDYVLNITTQQPEENCDLQQFWAIESTGTSSPTLDNNDREYVQSYINSSITHQSDGSYIARFPWKEFHPPLPTNRTTCERRTCSLLTNWHKHLTFCKYTTTFS